MEICGAEASKGTHNIADPRLATGIDHFVNSLEQNAPLPTRLVVMPFERGSGRVSQTIIGDWHGSLLNPHLDPKREIPEEQAANRIWTNFESEPCDRSVKDGYESVSAPRVFMNPISRADREWVKHEARESDDPRPFACFFWLLAHAVILAIRSVGAASTFRAQPSVFSVALALG
jgi:hypothetical protein